MIKILTKLHTIMSEVDIIEKDAVNTFHKYKYTSEFAIKNTMHPLLVKHGVLFTIEALPPIVKEYKNLKGDLKLITDVPVNYCFYDVVSGEKLCGTFVGTGEDSGDKGTYKAITGAIKYILTSTFLIPTGDDPENENGNTATPVQHKPIQQPAKPIQPSAHRNNEMLPDAILNIIKKLPPCKGCGKGRTYVKAGIRKTGPKAGEPYGAFYTCITERDQKTAACLKDQLNEAFAKDIIANNQAEWDNLASTN